jgi:thiol-disulfide isomerase/thioredoxin
MRKFCVQLVQHHGLPTNEIMNARYNPLGSLVLHFTAFIGLGALLTQAQPANDMFANRTVITGTNIVVTGSSVGATKEPGEPNHAGNAGGASVWWSWTAPSAGTVTITTARSSFDTVLGVYTGSSVSSLSMVASNDDENTDGDIYTSKVVFDVMWNQTYQIAVDGYDGGSGSVQLSVQLTPPKPTPGAPAWQLPDQNGVMVHSSDFAGKVVMLDFWATWCGPCKAEMPDLVALQEQYRADGLVIVGMDVSGSGDTASSIRSFLASWTPAINYQIVMSTSATETDYGGIDAIPATFIIDRQNILRKQFIGTQSRNTLEQQVIPLLYGNARLGCRRSGNQMTLCWPTNALSFTLESATNVLRPTWSTWPTLPGVVNGTNIVQVPMTSSTRLFRLRMSY